MSSCPIRTYRRLRDEHDHGNGTWRAIVTTWRIFCHLVTWGAAAAAVSPLWGVLTDDGSLAARELADELTIVGVFGAFTCLLVAYVRGRGLGKAEPNLLWFADDRAAWYLRRVLRRLPWTFVATLGVGLVTYLVSRGELRAPLELAVFCAALPLFLLGWSAADSVEDAGCGGMLAVLVVSLATLFMQDGLGWRGSIGALWVTLVVANRAAVCVGGGWMAGLAAVATSLVLLLGVPWLIGGSGHDHPIAPYVAGALALWPWLIAVGQIPAGARLVHERGLLVEFEDASDDEWTATDAHLGRGHAAHPSPPRVVPHPEAAWIASWTRFVDDLPSVRRKEWSDWVAGLVYGVLMTAFTLIGVASAAFAVGVADTRPGLALGAILVAATFARQVAPVDDEETAYLLGMDVVDRERLALRMELTTATLAGVVVASLTAAWYGSADAWIACGVLTCALACRAGLRGWVHDWTGMLGFVAIGAAAVLAVVGAFDVQSWLLPVPALLGISGAAAVLGAIGIWRRLHARSEADWRSFLATERWDLGE